jgi:CBS domain-containing protein
MNGKIKDLMTKDVATLHANDSLVDAAQRMRQRDVGSMPVVEDGNTVVGALTDRDITVRAIAEGLDPARTKVGSVMTRDVVCCYEDQEIIEAIELMDRYKVRRMPVVDRERHLRGLFTIGKVARTEEHEDPATRLFRSVTEPPVK